MGRNEKTSFDFFRVETDFFNNKKIKSLRRLYGPIGLSTYLYLLAYIYGHDGYYVKFSSLEDLSYDIAEAISGDNVGKVARRVAECINYLADSDLIDKGYLAEGIITSVSMQGQYIAMCKACRRLIKLPKYCLIDEDSFKSSEKEITSEEIPISSEEIPISSEKMQHIREEEIIVSKTERKEKEIINNKPRESYETVMDDMCLEEDVKPMMWSFIKHCQLNGKTLTNDKLVNILFEMDKQRLSPAEKIQALEAAVNGGYYDIKRQRKD